ncbi:hypothetical protein Droror1_Dr00025333, partial [Drosera rotundifolia]
MVARTITNSVVPRSSTQNEIQVPANEIQASYEQDTNTPHRTNPKPQSARRSSQEQQPRQFEYFTKIPQTPSRIDSFDSTNQKYPASPHPTLQQTHQHDAKPHFVVILAR